MVLLGARNVVEPFHQAALAHRIDLEAVHLPFRVRDGLLRQVHRDLRAGLNRTLIASIGPVSSDALKKFGVAVGLEPRPPKLGPLVEALDAALSR